MRLLSFLTEIEAAIRTQAKAPEGSVWNTFRIISPSGIARLTLSRVPGVDTAVPEGSIELVHHQLADGHFSVDVKLSWVGSQQTTKLYVYSSSCSNWTREAEGAADIWLAKFRALKAAV